MSKSLRIILVLIIAVLPLTAQSKEPAKTPPEMTPEEQKEFNDNCLKVAIAGPDATANNRIVSNTWTGSRGLTSLSEVDFYQLAGFPTEAARAAHYKTVGWALAAGGGVMEIGGIALSVVASSSVSGYSSNGALGSVNLTVFLGGLALALAGIVPLSIGIDRLRHDWSESDRAQSAADYYNQGLIKKIMVRPGGS